MSDRREKFRERLAQVGGQTRPLVWRECDRVFVTSEDIDYSDADAYEVVVVLRVRQVVSAQLVDQADIPVSELVLDQLRHDLTRAAKKLGRSVEGPTEDPWP